MTLPRTAERLEAGSLVIGPRRYCIERRLGAGDCSTTFEASCLDALEGVDTSIPVRVALKVRRARTPQEADALVKRERYVAETMAEAWRDPGSSARVPKAGGHPLSGCVGILRLLVPERSFDPIAFAVRLLDLGPGFARVAAQNLGEGTMAELLCEKRHAQLHIVVPGRERLAIVGRLSGAESRPGGAVLLISVSPERPELAAQFFPDPALYYSEDRSGDGATILFPTAVPARRLPIPKLYDAWTEGTRAFIAQEYFPAGSLAGVFGEAGKLAPVTAWELARHLLRILVAAHRAGVLHLGLKPANVLLDGVGSCVVSDFAVTSAAWIASRADATASGAKGYDAPEQRDPRPQGDARTDLYALGATLWAASAGIDLLTVPATDPSLAGGQTGLPRLSSVREGADTRFDELLMLLLAQSPAMRPGGAGEVLARIEHLLAGTASPGPQGRFLEPEEVRRTLDTLTDPLLLEVRDRILRECHVVRFEDGEALCTQGEMSHFAYLLLDGNVAVDRGDETIGTIRRQGVFIGEVATLAGAHRTATVRAKGRVDAIILRAADLESLLMGSPALALRLVKQLAERVVAESARSAARPQPAT